jgi:hypothetical protein
MHKISYNTCRNKMLICSCGVPPKSCSRVTKWHACHRFVIPSLACRWVLEEHTASIFMVFRPEDGGSMFLRNVGTHLSDYNTVIRQKTINWNFTIVISSKQTESLAVAVTPADLGVCCHEYTSAGEVAASARRLRQFWSYLMIGIQFEVLKFVLVLRIVKKMWERSVMFACSSVIRRKLRDRIGQCSVSTNYVELLNFELVFTHGRQYNFCVYLSSSRTDFWLNLILSISTMWVLSCTHLNHFN